MIYEEAYTVTSWGESSALMYEPLTVFEKATIGALQILVIYIDIIYLYEKQDRNASKP